METSKEQNKNKLVEKGDILGNSGKEFEFVGCEGICKCISLLPVSCLQEHRWEPNKKKKARSLVGGFKGVTSLLLFLKSTSFPCSLVFLLFHNGIWVIACVIPS